MARHPLRLALHVAAAVWIAVSAVAADVVAPVDLAPAPISALGAAKSVVLIPALTPGLNPPLAAPALAAPVFAPAAPALAAVPALAAAYSPAAFNTGFAAHGPAVDPAILMGAGRPDRESARPGVFGDSKLDWIFDGDRPGRAALLEPAAAATVQVPPGVGKHFYEDGVIGRRAAGIKMAHTRGKFLAALEGQGRIVSDTPVPGLDGFSVVAYKFFKGDGHGHVTSTLKDGEPMLKTVVDEARWSPERISALARSLFGRETHAPGEAPPGSGATYQIYVTRDGVRYVGWVEKASGKLVSFGVDKILP